MSTLGKKHEANFSKNFHQKGIPLLVSPLVLRSKNMGQVDMARILDNQIEVAEVKSGGHISVSQQSRLLKSAEFLSIILKKSAKLTFAFRQKNKSLPNSENFINL